MNDDLWAATVPAARALAGERAARPLDQDITEPVERPALPPDRDATGPVGPEPAATSKVTESVASTPNPDAATVALGRVASGAGSAAGDAAGVSPERTAVMPVTDVQPVPKSTTDRGRDRPRRRRRRLGWRLALAAFAIGLGYFAVSLFQVWSTGRADQARAVDAIVVLGAAQYDGRPSPQLQARLDEVLRLWPEDYAPVVVVTGGKLPEDRFTEAEASARYLIERGVPESAILYENEGATTFESLRSTAAILEERGLDSVLLVTDPFHSLRSRLIAEEVGLEAYVAPTQTSVISGGRNAALHLKEAGGVAVGRLIGFERLSGLVG